jgi:hypothetical protein
MRRAATLSVFALLAVTLALAQNPSGTSGNPPQQQTSPSTTQSPANPQTPGTQPVTPATPEKTDSGTPVNNPNATTPPDNRNTIPGSATGENQQTNPQSDQPAGNPQTQTPPQGGFGQRAAAAANGTDQVPANTQIHAVLDTPLSTKTAKPGDRFTATITQPIRGASGAVLIPAGARIEGEVAEAEAGKAVAVLRGRGKLNLRFRDIALPNGQTVPLAATLVSVNSTNGKNTRTADQEGQVQSGTRGRDVAKDVGIGAGIGTLAGLIFGSPLKGLAIGGLAGGGYVLATQGKDVDLPAQTGMVIRLDQPLSVFGSVPPQ